VGPRKPPLDGSGYVLIKTGISEISDVEHSGKDVTTLTTLLRFVSPEGDKVKDVVQEAFVLLGLLYCRFDENAYAKIRGVATGGIQGRLSPPP